MPGKDLVRFGKDKRKLGRPGREFCEDDDHEEVRTVWKVVRKA